MIQNQLAGHPPELSDTSVSSVRVIYPDLHGVARGKDVPLVEFDRVSDHGLAFCAAVMATDLRHTPVHGRRDRLSRHGREARPRVADAGALGARRRLLHRRRRTRSAAGSGSRPTRAAPSAAPSPPTTSSGSRRSSARSWSSSSASATSTGELTRYVDNLSMVYTVGPQADPRGVVRQITEALAGMGMGTFAANHEFMNSQYEINLRHGPALTAADRAFRLKVAVKDVAALNGHARHVHGQAVQRPGRLGLPPAHQRRPRRRQRVRRPRRPATACRTSCAASPPACSPTRPALMAFLNPTINAYRRIVPDSLAPISVNWGWDNRTTFVRIPAERGRADARRAARSATAARTRTSAIAATLFAGLHGLREELPLADPISRRRLHAERGRAGACRLSLEAALDALEADDVPARRDRRRDRRRRSSP